MVRTSNVRDKHRAIAAALLEGERKAIWLGALAMKHAAFSELRSLAATITRLTGATLGVLAEGAMPPARISRAPFRIVMPGGQSVRPGFRPRRCCASRRRPMCCLAASSRGSIR